MITKQKTTIDYIKQSDYVGLLEYYFEDESRILEIHADRIGWVLTNIRNACRRTGDRSLINRSYDLKRKVTEIHPDCPLFKQSPEWLKNFHLRKYSLVRDYFLEHPERFWTEVLPEKQSHILDRLFKYAYDYKASEE